MRAIGGTWQLETEEPQSMEINGYMHFYFAIVTDAAKDDKYPDGTGVAVVVWPLEDDSPETQVERLATAKAIVAAHEMAKASVEESKP